MEKFAVKNSVRNEKKSPLFSSSKTTQIICELRCMFGQIKIIFVLLDPSIICQVVKMLLPVSTNESMDFMTSSQ